MRAAFERPVVFTLMNSFSTSEDTRAFLAQGHADLLQVREGLGCGQRGTGREGGAGDGTRCEVGTSPPRH